MEIYDATIDGVREIAAALGIYLEEKKPREEGDVRVNLKPVAGSNTWRAVNVGAGRFKHNLCQHAQYAFIARVLARFPDAVIKTYFNTWTYALFQAGARVWAEEKIRQSAALEACNCTNEMIAETMLSPDEIREAVLA